MSFLLLPEDVRTEILEEACNKLEALGGGKVSVEQAAVLAGVIFALTGDRVVTNDSSGG